MDGRIVDWPIGEPSDVVIRRVEGVSEIEWTVTPSRRSNARPERWRLRIGPDGNPESLTRVGESITPVNVLA
ncbi:MAG: hypothetical protein JSS86_00115 [Cyanobacteria bacterium SZAS LIN-2]|nr:hypothetical protein [Cyanobacteria bacterium SZAS LIN-2]